MTCICEKYDYPINYFIVIGLKKFGVYFYNTKNLGHFHTTANRRIVVRNENETLLEGNETYFNGGKRHRIGKSLDIN